MRIWRKRAMAPVVDEQGTSYRMELLRAIARVHRDIDLAPPAEQPPLVDHLRGLLKDLHDLEYSVAQTEAEALRREIEGLQARVAQLEGLLKLQRVEPVKPPRRLA